MNYRSRIFLITVSCCCAINSMAMDKQNINATSDGTEKAEQIEKASNLQLATQFNPKAVTLEQLKAFLCAASAMNDKVNKISALYWEMEYSIRDIPKEKIEIFNKHKEDLANSIKSFCEEYKIYNNIFKSLTRLTNELQDNSLHKYAGLDSNYCSQRAKEQNSALAQTLSNLWDNLRDIENSKY
jgi:hypothetical protein